MKQHGTDGSTTLRVVCIVLFCAFTFLYTFFYRADTLAVTQHILSDGATSYNSTIGAIVITAALTILQVVVRRLTHHGLFTYALTFFPSMTLLGLLSVICDRVIGGQGLILPTIIAAVAIALWVVMSAASKVLMLQPESSGLFSRPMSINLLLMVLMMAVVGIGCGGDECTHYRCRIERRLLAGNYEEALRVGELSQVRDKHITQLRMFALAKLDMAGEALFTYPIGGTGDDLIPSEAGDLLFFSSDSITAFADSIPRDYALCALLIDRDIDGFAREVTRWYEVNDSLPQHYREALTLYTHLRSEPVVTYHNAVMDTDFDDLQALEHQYRNRHEASRPVYSQYKGTYWWYYNYE